MSRDFSLHPQQNQPSLTTEMLDQIASEALQLMQQLSSFSDQALSSRKIDPVNFFYPFPGPNRDGPGGGW
jgi:hypothetical protein